jgi:hypothetical protein
MVQIPQLLVPLIVPLIDGQQIFRCDLILFTPSRYHEEAINIIAVVGASFNYKYKPRDCKPFGRY